MSVISNATSGGSPTIRLSEYMRTLSQIESVAETVDFGHIKRHYYQSHRNLNPSGIVPVGPELAFMSKASAETTQR